jgi:4-carboxymuconolactone decarboxylase
MSSESYDKGLAMRRRWLGDAHVNASLEGADDFTRPLQELVSEHAWGSVWVRDGLPLKTRSMLTLALLVAVNRPHELKLHIRAALRNGITKDELREVLLHTHAYCGWPATVDAFRSAKEVLAEPPAKG